LLVYLWRFLGKEIRGWKGGWQGEKRGEERRGKERRNIQ
jgi:hypothetical protein